jgi:monofunctional biosynthetic peptidoglycan transglycosylase
MSLPVIQLTSWLWPTLGAIAVLLILPILQAWRLRDHRPDWTLLMRCRQILGWWEWLLSGGQKPKPVRYHYWIPIEEISPWILHSVWVQEDISFYRHNGFAWDFFFKGISAWILRKGPLMGSSTLTQQLARSIFFPAGLRFIRKLPEMYYTYWMEKFLSKKRIYELYLNYVEFGVMVFGVEAAAQINYGQSARAIEKEQAVELAALLPAPRTWRVHKPTPNYIKQKDRIRPKLDIHPFPDQLKFQHGDALSSSETPVRPLDIAGKTP